MEYTVNIPEWQLKDVDNTLRMVSNAFESSKKETCLDRCIVKAQEYVKKALAFRVPSSPVMSEDSDELKSVKLQNRLRLFEDEKGSTLLTIGEMKLIADSLVKEGYLIGTRSIVPEMTDEEIVKKCMEYIKTKNGDKEVNQDHLSLMILGIDCYRNWLRSQINK